MDILYNLQLMREGAPAAVNYILAYFSDSMLLICPVIAMILFLCVDKKLGIITFLNMAIGNAVANVLKLCMCVYRPWMSDSRLYPCSLIAKNATGYSFPSGHTMQTVTTLGGIGMGAELKNKKRYFSIASFVIVLVAFARMYLGAHSFADVIASIILGCILVGVNTYILKLVYSREGKYDHRLLVIVFLVCVASSLYILFKNYPLEYDAAGELIADPYVMMKDGFMAIGLLMGGTLAWYLERKYINFDISGTTKQKWIRGIIAVIITALPLVLIKKILFFADPRLMTFFRFFLPPLITMNLYPIVIKLYRNNKK